MVTAHRRLIPLAALVALALPASAGAAPKLSVKPAIQSSRLVVTVSSTRALPRRSRPTAVSVTGAGATYKLKRASSSARKSTWRSGMLTAPQVAALSGASLRVKVKTPAGSVTKTVSVPAAPTAPGGPAPAPPGAAPPQVPGVTLTRDDAAGRQALGAGDLLLERPEIGNVTQTYYRLFVYGNGVFKFERADWNQVSGEICNMDAHREGTWAFAEGYRYAEQGGGVAVKLSTVTNGQAGNELLIFPNGDGHVYVGPQAVQFERNPNMRDQC